MNQRETIQQALNLLRKYRSNVGPSQVHDQHLEVQAERVAQIVGKLKAPHSLILGDPVGTGKTPVSLVAAWLLLNLGEVRYALLVAPNQAVAKQWRDRAKHLALGESARWQSSKLRVVTKKNVPASPSPDPAATLIIIDEAHRGLQSDKTPVYQKLKPIAAGTRLLLVTATPFQLTTSGFLNMLGLSSHATGQRRSTIEQYGKAMAHLLKVWHRVDSDLNDQRLWAAVSRVQTLGVQAARSLAAHMLDPYPTARMGIPEIPPLHETRITKAHKDWQLGYQVARIIPELVSQSGDMFQRRLLSSNRAFWEGEAGQTLLKEAQNNSRLARLRAELMAHLGNELRHPRVAATVDWVCARARKRHVLVFCTFVKTQEVLREELARKLGEDQVCAPQNVGQLGEVKARFRSATARPLVLVVRDNLSESIDLDGGRPCLVHHDLTWNPARMVQRWGRVVRICSNFEAVAAEDIFCPVLALEADMRLHKTVSNRQELVNLLLPREKQEAWHVLPSEVLAAIFASEEGRPGPSHDARCDLG